MTDITGLQRYVRRIVKGATFLDKLISNLALYSLMFTVLTMLFMTILSIILRRWQITVLWIDPCVRHLFFLSAFLGGTLAIGRRQHIAVDIVGKILENAQKFTLKKHLERIVYLVAMITLSWLTIGAIQFVDYAFKYEGVEFLGIHRGVLVSIIPFGCILMLYRFFYLFLTSFQCFSEASTEVHS
ncbi:MAG: TRAP transporter small permease subunit [Oligoflexia bacterium]|nr:TRAP transporter small permease subunit [Oligoflexia bacterium]